VKRGIKTFQLRQSSTQSLRRRRNSAGDRRTYYIEAGAGHDRSPGCEFFAPGPRRAKIKRATCGGARLDSARPTRASQYVEKRRAGQDHLNRIWAHDMVTSDTTPVNSHNRLAAPEDGVRSTSRQSILRGPNEKYL